MKKLLPTLLCCLLFTQSFAQTERKVSTFLLTQYNKTLNDYTKGNNPWSIGLGLQAFLNNKSKFKPTIELTGDIYLESDKVLYSNPDGSWPKDGNDVGSMTNLFAGASYHPVNNIYISLMAGPSFISKQTLFGIKPSVGFYFSKTHRWTAKVSYINVFNRTKGISDGDFGSLSFALGVKLF
ncbi:MAG: hypothetical protein ABI123_05785 [Ginsengibacter sp.]